jgi:hypothetical protein
LPSAGNCIGKIVKSNSHVDYVCQVFGPGEVDVVPAPTEYTFGTFVAVDLDEGAGSLVGIIYNTLLTNPEYGSFGPRLSPRSEVEIFSPDYLAETATLLGVPPGTVMSRLHRARRRIRTQLDHHDDLRGNRS